MNVREAVTLAREHVAGLLGGEAAPNLGLEDVNFDDHFNLWSVTLGFSPAASEAPLPPATRDVRVVTIADGDRKVISVKSRQAGS